MCALDITSNLNLFYVTQAGTTFNLYEVDLDDYTIPQRPTFSYDAS